MAERLHDVVAAQAQRALPAFMAPLLEEVARRFPTSVHAVLFYGSCRRSNRADGVVDLYVVLKDGRDLKGLNWMLSRILPPSVYFLSVSPSVEDSAGNEEIRCKCSTILLPAFRSGTSERWFLPYLWARFSQPVTLAYVAGGGTGTDRPDGFSGATTDDNLSEATSDPSEATNDPSEATAEMLRCLKRAAEVFVRRAVPLMGDVFTSEEYWTTALAMSYRTELRSESTDKIRELYILERAHLDRLLASAAAESPLFEARHDGTLVHYANRAPLTLRRSTRWAWRARVVIGKLLSLGRILKSTYTFEGGLDYVVWKLERHSGQSIPVPDRVRRRPWLRIWGFFWRLYRQGVFR